MKKIILTVELTYDDEFMHGNDSKAITIFHEHVLFNEEEPLVLRSNSLGDDIGVVRVLKIEESEQ